MARTPAPAPHAARSAADTATTPAPAPVAPAAGDSPAAAVLAALSADPAGAAVAVIAARAGISVPAARQALIAHEKNGTATRVKGSRPGIADTWQPAATEATGDEQPAAEPADAGQPTPVTPDGTAEGQQAEAATEPDPAVTAEAAGSVAAIAQAADEAGKALAAGNLDVAIAALDTARDLAAQGRRVIKAAASGRRAPATRPGALRDLVEEHLRKFPGTAFTPHQVGKVLTRSAGAVANALDKLVSLGVAQMVTDKPRTYRLAPAPHLPARPRPGRGRRARHQRGDGGQRRVTRGPRGRCGRDGSGCRPGRTVCMRTCRTHDVPAPSACAACRSRPGTSGRWRSAFPPGIWRVNEWTITGLILAGAARAPLRPVPAREARRPWRAPCSPEADAADGGVLPGGVLAAVPPRWTSRLARQGSGPSRARRKSLRVSARTGSETFDVSG